MRINPYVARYLLFYPIVFLRGERVAKYLREYSRTQWLSSDELRSYQLGKLRRLLRFAVDTVPYYRRAYRNIDVSSVRTLEDLARLPFIDKATLREHATALHSRKLPLLTSAKTTGGSTGQPVTVTKSAKSLAMERAATWRSYGWAGVRIGDPQVRFWGVPSRATDRRRHRIAAIASNRIRLSAFQFTGADLGRYYRKLRSFRPRYLYGYVSMLSTFADYIEANRLPAPCPLKCIITTSEVLTRPTRQHLAQVFDTNVYNEYGCGEVGSIAHECEHGSMHLMSENLIVEIVAGRTGNGSTATGEIVVTELNNLAMPLIRYRLADYAEATVTPCACDRGLPVVSDIHGRAYDIITAPNGSRYHGEFFMYVIEDARKRNLNISQFQIIQTAEDALTVRLVPDLHHSPDTEKFIRDRIAPRTGMSVTFELVSSITREESGKLRLIKAL